MKEKKFRLPEVIECQVEENLSAGVYEYPGVLVPRRRNSVCRRLSGVKLKKNCLPYVNVGTLGSRRNSVCRRMLNVGLKKLRLPEVIECRAEETSSAGGYQA